MDFEFGVLVTFQTLDETRKWRETCEEGIWPRAALLAVRVRALPLNVVDAANEVDVLDSVHETVEFIGDEESNELELAGHRRRSHLDAGIAWSTDSEENSEEPISRPAAKNGQGVEEECADEHQPGEGPRCWCDVFWRNLVEREEEAIAQRHEEECRHLGSARSTVAHFEEGSIIKYRP